MAVLTAMLEAGTALALIGIASTPAAASDEVVVFARKREESLQSVPLAVSAFSGEALRQQSVQDITDLQNQVPSLHFEDGVTDQSAVLMTIRGQTQVDNFLSTDPSVGVYLDGVYLPRQLGLKSNLLDIERIEVLKGPQGTLYGKNTTGGAINVFTKKPHYNGFSGFIDGSAGNYGMREISGGINIPIVQDKLAARLVGLVGKHDGYGQTASGQELKDEATRLIRTHILFNPTEKLEILLSGDWQSLRGGGGIPKLTAVIPGAAAGFEAGLELGNPFIGDAALQGLIGGDFYTSAITGPNNSRYDGGGGSVTVTADLGGVTAKSITAYRRFTRKSNNDYDASPFTIVEALTYTTDAFISTEFNLSGSLLSDKLQWLAGFYYSTERGTEGSVTTALPFLSPINPSVIDGLIKNEGWAPYAQATLALTDKLNLTAGIRWTEETKTSESRNRFTDQSLPGAPELCGIAPQLLDEPGRCAATIESTFSDYSYLASVDYQFAPTVLGYVKTSRGFKSGGQNVSGSSDPSVFRSFSPEIATDYEIGLKSDWFENRLRVNVAGYYTRYSDIQRAVVIVTSGGLGTATENAAKATIKGAELELTVKPLENLTLFGTLTYTDAEYDEFKDVTGDRSAEPFPVPELAYSLSGRYVVPLSCGEFAFQADWSWRDKTVYQSTALIRSSVTQESFGLLNMRASFAIPDSGFEVAVFGRNILDEEYYASALTIEALGFNAAFAGDPAVWGIQLRKTFGAD